MASAVIHFNDGGKGILDIMEKCGFSPGHYTVSGYARSDRARVKSMNVKASSLCMQRRKKLRAQRKGWQDKESQDKSYAPGAF